MSLVPPAMPKEKKGILPSFLEKKIFKVKYVHAISDLPLCVFFFNKMISYFQRLGKAERLDLTKFALVWNQIIISFRSEDLISDRYTLILCCNLGFIRPVKENVVLQRDGFDDDAHVTRASSWFYSLAIVFTCQKGKLIYFMVHDILLFD